MKSILHFLSIASMLMTSAAASAAPGTNNQKPDYIVLDDATTIMSRADEATGPWTPEGDVKWYMRASNALATLFNLVVDSRIQGNAMDIYYAEDGAVYMNRPVNNILGNRYIKGTINATGDDITFDFPQTLGIKSNGEKLNLYLGKITARNSETPDLIEEVILCDDQTYHMSIAADGSLKPATGYEETLIGYFIDGQFTGFGDYGYEITLQNDKALTPPDGLKTTTCTWECNGEPTEHSVYTGVGNYAKIGFDGDDVWIQGTSGIMPEAWIKGKRQNDGSITFDSMQLLGLYKPQHTPLTWLYVYGVKFAPGGSEDEPELVLATPTESYTLKKESDTSYSCSIPVVQGTRETINKTFMTLTFAFTQRVDNPVMVISDKLGQPATPQTPYVLAAMSFGDGIYYVHYAIPQTDTDGLLMDPEQLFYEIYIDGEQFTVMPETYPGAPAEGYKLVPYRFTDDMQNILSAWIEGSPNHDLITYVPIEKTVAVRSVYLAGGERHESGLMTINIADGIESVSEDESPVISTEYRSISGARVNSDYRGLRLKTELRTDGSRTTVKEIAR